MGRPISYEMQMMFVGSPGAFEEAMNTGSGITRLDYIQSYDFSFNVERNPLKQIGSDSFATRQTQFAPDVNLNIQYYLNDGWNDKFIGLDISPDSSGNPFDTILSSTGDRNFYVSIAQDDGIDQNLKTGIVNSNVLGIGNCYITSYEISVSVNELATVSCSFVGANANVQNYETSKYLPSVNALSSGQNAEDVNKNFALNFNSNARTEEYFSKVKDNFTGGCPYSKCKITPNFQSNATTSPLTFGFFDAVANNFQSMQFSVQFDRKPLYGFGNNHPYTRKVQRPIVATLALSALIDDFQAENLSKIFHKEGGAKSSILIEFFNFSDLKKFGLALDSLTLESYSLGARIGGRVLVETNWSVEIKNGDESNVKMIGSYRNALSNEIIINESFSVSALFYKIIGAGEGGLGLTPDGEVWSWGLNSQGQLGNNSTINKLTPFKISGAEKTFCKVCGGIATVAVIDKYGQAWGWGSNSSGQLGNNSVSSQRTPVSVGGVKKTFCEISTAESHSLAIDKYGIVWAWGANGFGALGINSTVNSVRTPISIRGQTKTFCKISTGSASFGIDKYGKAWGWGLNTYGGLGIDSTVISVRTPVSLRGQPKTFCHIAAIWAHAAVIDQYGQVWAWGRNNNGAIGNGEFVSRRTPVSVAGEKKTFCQIAGIVSGSDTSFLSLDKNGQIWGWGGNSNLILGIRSDSTNTPVSILGTKKTFCQIAQGKFGAYAIDKYSRAWAWGSRQSGLLGNNEFSYIFTPVKVGGSQKTFCEINAGDISVSISIAIDKYNRIWGWGYNVSGQIGDNSTIFRYTPVSIIGSLNTNANTVCKIETGPSFSMALTKSGEIWAWGSNSVGQLGINSTISQTTPVSIGGQKKTFCHITLGSSTALAIDKYGQAWGWGYNGYGILGINSTVSQRTPVSIGATKRTFCKIETGNRFSVGIDQYGQIWAWGRNIFGSLGNNSTISQRTPVSIGGQKKTFCHISAGNRPAAIDFNGQIWIWGTAFAASTPTKIAGQVKTFCQIEAGTAHSLAIDKHGQIWSWGINSFGQLGNASTVSYQTPVQVYGKCKIFCRAHAGESFSIALEKNGQIWVWGNRTALGINSHSYASTPVRICNF